MGFVLFVAVVLLPACGKDDVTKETDEDVELYFPPVGSAVWESVTPESEGWNPDELTNLYSYLEDKDTRAFIILLNGRIVVEKYWGNNITNTAPFDQNSNWYWASAGKTITALLVGIAQEEGFLDIDDKTSDYLGVNWTSMDTAQEALITIKHQLTMTTGLDYQVADPDCTEPGCLQYRKDAGSQWFYHNAPYTLLEEVVSTATGISYNQYTDERLEHKTGMSGTWLKSGYNKVYWSTARDAARYGLMIFNRGKWDDEQVLADEAYFEAMVNTSQQLNPSYGYLFWLNGKSSIILPGLPTSFNTSLAPNAPSDLFMAAGKNGQFIDVIPSSNMVVVRMGEAPDGSLVPAIFHDEMWEKIMAALKK
jgi:CubicO group peptidase (beta-lactamase class C family)